jgi:hypothetical protein
MITMNQQEKRIKFYQYPAEYNIGDTLSKPILEYFFGNVKQVNDKERNKIIAIGSIMGKVLPGDVVWGTGCMYEKPCRVNAKFLAVRGKLTRDLIVGSAVPEVYGDPALLLPLIYNPEIQKEYEVGIIPHYIDKQIVKDRLVFEEGYNLFIDVALPYKEFVDKVKSCRRIMSSSLHGIVIAEAYGIPAEWCEYSDKVLGHGFKFRDYLTGTGREEQGPGEFPPIRNLKEIQNKLIKVLKNYYGI